MKNFGFAIACLLLMQTGNAQNVLKVQPGANITTTGGAVITLHNMDLDNDGTINQLPLQGYFAFTGAADNTISGTAVPLFNILHMVKTGAGKLLLQQNIQVGSSITFTSGLIDLNTKNILLQPTAFLNGESETSRIIGSHGGYVEITNTLNGPVMVNPGNLGAVITSLQNLGNTVIRRGHVSQVNGQGIGSTIFRYYDIFPANNASLNATLRIQYAEAELNSLDENLLALWRSANNISWTNDGFTSRDMTLNYVEKTGINNFSRFTLSTINNALPLQFILFTVHCNDNQVDIKWKTALEQNTSYFNVERSTDGISWTTIATLPAAGNSSAERSYFYTDQRSLPGRTFYRIAEYDLDGRKHLTGINRTNCEGTEGLKAWPNPARDVFWINIITHVASPVSIQIFDNTGALIQTHNNNLLAGSNQLHINLTQLPAGTYHVVATWHNGATKKSFNMVRMD
jgi:hypothetical protein